MGSNKKTDKKILSDMQMEKETRTILEESEMLDSDSDVAVSKKQLQVLFSHLHKMKTVANDADVRCALEKKCSDEKNRAYEEALEAASQKIKKLKLDNSQLKNDLEIYKVKRNQGACEFEKEFSTIINIDDDEFSATKKKEKVEALYKEKSSEIDELKKRLKCMLE